MDDERISVEFVRLIQIQQQKYRMEFEQMF